MSSKTLFALFAAGTLCVSGVALGQNDTQPKKEQPKTTPAPKAQPQAAPAHGNGKEHGPPQGGGGGKEKGKGKGGW